MKTIAVLFLFAMMACAYSQYLGSYGYGYNTYTPGARVSHYQSSVPYAGHAAYSYGYAAHPYNRWW